MTASSDNTHSPAEHHTLVLSQDPFRNRHHLSPGAIYSCTRSARLVGQLKHLLDKTPYLVLVSGPSGSGKSVVLDQFLSALDKKDYKQLQLDAASGLSGVELLSQVADVFANPRKKAAEIHQLFKSQLARGKTPLLIIDSAELLDQRTLQLCLRLTEHGLRLLLFADTELESRLSQIHRDLAKNAATLPDIQVQRIPPFEFQQTGCYLRHQFLSAGYGGPLPFDDKLLRQIHEESGGYPGNINRIAHRLLKNGVRRPASPPVDIHTHRGASKSMLVFGLLLSVIIAVTLVLLLRDKLDLSDLSFPAGTDTQASSAISDLLNQRLDTPDIPFAADISEPTAVAEQTPGESVADTALISGDPVGDATPSQDPAEPSKPADVMATVAPANDTVDATVAQQDSPADTVQPITATVTEQPAPVETAGSAKPVPPPEPAPEPKLGPDLGTTTTATAENTPPATSSEPATIATAQDLLALNPRHYTMQIMSGRKLKSIMNFVADNQIEQDSAWYEIQRKGKPWYSLTYKSFGSRQAALDALDAIPKALRNKKPWIRRLSAIQKSIKASRPPAE